jgi:argininosuccinate lyase
MTLRDEVLELSRSLLQFELALIRLAKRNITSVFPGYTHLQPAQPISFAHYLLTNFFALSRDTERLLEAYSRINRSPMGAAAIAGTSVPLDRGLIARLLGFDGIVETSLDAVGGRDFALEALGVVALIATDLSRISADLLFYSSAEANLIEIPDGFASTSSIMPQKKNADPVELIRAKSAKIAGEFAVAVTLLHGLPSGYNLDYQEITPMLWQSFDELRSCLQILTSLIGEIRLTKGIAERRYLQFTTATEIANILVKEENLPFRTAHQKVGLAVKSAMKQGKQLSEMTQVDWDRVLGFTLKQRTLKLIARTLDLNLQLNTYQTIGSPNPRETRRLIALAVTRWRVLAKTITDARTRTESGLRQLRRMTSTT